MSQKLGFPFLGLRLTTLIFWIGLILSVLSWLLAALASPYLGYTIPPPLTGFIMFLGVFLVGWALLGFAFLKEMLPKQRLIAFLFAVALLSTIFFVHLARVLVFGFLVPFI